MGNLRGTLKRTLLILAIPVILLFAVLKFATPRSVIVRWDYDYVHDPPCASVWAYDCVLGFHVFVGSPNNRSQQVFVANRFDAGHHLVSKQIETSFPANRFGYLQFCVAAVKQGQMTVMVESTPQCMKRWVLPFGIASDRTR
ncbi:MAG: hypothetical protein WA188_15310 [Terriglobales bacterium]